VDLLVDDVGHKRAQITMRKCGYIKCKVNVSKKVTDSDRTSVFTEITEVLSGMYVPSNGGGPGEKGLAEPAVRGVDDAGRAVLHGHGLVVGGGLCEAREQMKQEGTQGT